MKVACQLLKLMKKLVESKKNDVKKSNFLINLLVRPVDQQTRLNQNELFLVSSSCDQIFSLNLA